MNDYVSKRLQIRMKNESKNLNKNHHDHVSMIYTKLIDINLFVQCLVETHITNNNNNYVFNLPDPLKKFYL